MSDSLKVTFTLSGRQKELFKRACEVSGMKVCEFAKSASVLEVRKWMKTPSFQNAQVSSSGHLPRACASIEDNLLSKYNKCHSAKKDISGNSPQHQFGKGFIAKIDNNKFPERVFKAISENWESIQQSELSGVDMAELYNGYCKSIPDGQHACHPNSWISGGGWSNTEKNKGEATYGF
jgi:hypothetical protein